MTQEQYDAIMFACLDMWGLVTPDPVEAYHAYRIIEIRKGAPVIMGFDEFLKEWKDYIAARGSTGP